MNVNSQDGENSAHAIPVVSSDTSPSDIPDEMPDSKTINAGYATAYLDEVTENEAPKKRRSGFWIWLMILLLCLVIASLIYVLVTTEGIRIDTGDTSSPLSAQEVARNNAAWCASQQNDFIQDNKKNGQKVSQEIRTHIKKRVSVFGPPITELSANTEDEALKKIPEPHKQKDLRSTLGFCALQMKADSDVVSDPDLKKLLYSGSLGTYLDYESILKPKKRGFSAAQPLTKTMSKFKPTPASDYIYHLERGEYTPDKSKSSPVDNGEEDASHLDPLMYQLDAARYSFGVGGAQNRYDNAELSDEESIDALDHIESVIQGYAHVTEKDPRDMSYPLLTPVAGQPKGKGLILASLDSSIEIYNHLSPYSHQVPEINLWEESLYLLHYRMMIDSSAIGAFPGIENPAKATVESDLFGKSLINVGIGP
ncbi:MAG: hypothetical protein Q4P72_06965 [Eubacteriales bacterium]|nr:hypothetical protein [Eubacteriales bacterium]